MNRLIRSRPLRTCIAIVSMWTVALGPLMPAAHADPACGAVEFRFEPGAHRLQIAIWVEDQKGVVVDTPYITRATGQFGIANRPGAALLKTDCGWPYGRREMVLPVWAHRRNHHYPRIVMGGACGNSPESICKSGTACAGNCEDTTIAYHSEVSSTETYFCAPTGCVNGNDPDVVSCATPSGRSLSKGAYVDPTAMTAFSLYPPRADLTTFDPNRDSQDVNDFAKKNDLIAVSQATPKPNVPLATPIDWYPKNLPNGDYVAYIELSQEADFNDANHHPNAADTQMSWNGQGHDFLGQPSVVYRVPFHYDEKGGTAIATSYAGYGSWDGSDGMLWPAGDGTITTGKPGSGAGRLLDVSEPPDVFRFKVIVGGCNGGPHVCNTPPPPTDLKVTPSGTSLMIAFSSAGGPDAPNRYSVRYRVGGEAITDANFDQQVTGPSLAATTPNAVLSTTISGLMPDSAYSVAVRGIAQCGTASPVASITAKTGQMQFTTLHGCFIATAAFGTDMEPQVKALRSFRDHHLLNHAIGRVLVAAYYAFSPSVARAIASDESLRALVRNGLSPIVRVVNRLN